jgi:hypothetical protein
MHNFWIPTIIPVLIHDRERLRTLHIERCVFFKRRPPDRRLDIVNSFPDLQHIAQADHLTVGQEIFASRDRSYERVYEGPCIGLGNDIGDFDGVVEIGCDFVDAVGDLDERSYHQLHHSH